jgi:hypothetical protein
MTPLLIIIAAVAAFAVFVLIMRVTDHWWNVKVSEMIWIVLGLLAWFGDAWGLLQLFPATTG